MQLTRVLVLVVLIGLIPCLLGQKPKGKKKGRGKKGKLQAKGRSSTKGAGGDTQTYSELVNVLDKVRDIKADGDTVCKAFKSDDLKLNMTEPMTYDEILKMLTWTLKFNLKSGTKPLKVAPELKWKRDVVESLATIFKKGCPAEYVSTAFLNIVKELYMVYLNSLKFSKNTKSLWGKTLKTLKACESKNKLIKLSSKGYVAEFMFYRNLKGEEEKSSIYVPSELADVSLHSIDLIIDTVWWMFSYSFAACYPYMENKAVEMAQYKKLFFNDFLYDFLMRWQFGGADTMGYGPIFGDLNLEQAVTNVRFCVTAAYTQNGIADRQLVRPFSMIPNEEEIEVIHNRKTGESLSCSGAGICSSCTDTGICVSCTPEGICSTCNPQGICTPFDCDDSGSCSSLHCSGGSCESCEPGGSCDKLSCNPQGICTSCGNDGVCTSCTSSGICTTLSCTSSGFCSSCTPTGICNQLDCNPQGICSSCTPAGICVKVACAGGECKTTDDKSYS